MTFPYNLRTPPSKMLVFALPFACSITCRNAFRSAMVLITVTIAELCAMIAKPLYKKDSTDDVKSENGLAVGRLSLLFCCSSGLRLGVTPAPRLLFQT